MTMEKGRRRRREGEEGEISRIVEGEEILLWLGPALGRLSSLVSLFTCNWFGLYFNSIPDIKHQIYPILYGRSLALPGQDKVKKNNKRISQL